MPAKVLVVDDDARLRFILTLNLEGAGYQVFQAEDGRQALAIARAQQPELVILDLSLPSMDGLVVGQTLREDPGYPDCSILMLTARGQLDDKLKGFRHGADDYMVKPFDVPELLSRADALLRRVRRLDRPSAPLEYGPFRFFPDTLEIETLQGRLPFTPIEFAILQALAEAQGQIVSQETLVKLIWGEGRKEGQSGVRMHINRIRQRLEPRPDVPRYLLTIRGRGYRLAHDPS